MSCLLESKVVPSTPPLQGKSVLRVTSVPPQQGCRRLECGKDIFAQIVPLQNVVTFVTGEMVSNVGFCF